MHTEPSSTQDNSSPWFSKLINGCLRQKLLVLLMSALLVVVGIAYAPFGWQTGMPLQPVAVDAIPNLGENQQIVFSEWPGRSPQDVEDQLSYPLSVALMGVAGVKDVRTLSMYGFSSIAVIFDDSVEFYWSRSRLLEKLASLPADTLPEGVQPGLGPDATALGQVFWYTLEGRDPNGKTTAGWDLDELRSIQDWYLRTGLLAAEGISEVASIGGYQREYQIEVDPDLLRIHQVTLADVSSAVMAANLDVSAGSREINGVEYVLRGVGLVEKLSDIEQAAVRLAANNIPITVADVATVSIGPAQRRGALDVAGAEAVGGVVTVRQGFNPRQAIDNINAQLKQISRGLPAKAVIDWSDTKAQQVAAFASANSLPAWGTDNSRWTTFLQQHPATAWPEWLTLSQLTVVPFYDRSELINETLGTLQQALSLQLLVTIIVVLVLLWHLRAVFAVSIMLPLAVLLSFIGMKLLAVEANIVALAGIAIAIGTIVDMAIIVSENLIRQRQQQPELTAYRAVQRAMQEVGPAILTAISTTVISFLPVFSMTGAEGKLFGPLAYSKTLVLLAAALLALTLLPVLLFLLFSPRMQGIKNRFQPLRARLTGWHSRWLTGTPLARLSLPANLYGRGRALLLLSLLLGVTSLLAYFWQPLGPAAGLLSNTLLVALLLAVVLLFFWLFLVSYLPLLRLILKVKLLFLLLPMLLVGHGLTIWLGAERVLPWVATDSATAQRYPGLGREFMPALDEGAFLLMPSLMPHASMAEAIAVLQQQDQAIAAIPEVRSVVGKVGRAETALDPAPLGMIETLIQYHSEFKTDEQGKRVYFRFDPDSQQFVRDSTGQLIPDSQGRPYRQWREHITSPDDIWQEIIQAAQLPGVTSAPKLQPIETRQLMLQTGMRAAMGLKLAAPDLATLEQLALALEQLIREAPAVNPATVNAERIVGQPYLEIHPDRTAIARHGLSMQLVQQAIANAIGGMDAGQIIDGRERYPIRVRYMRERRDTLEQLTGVLIDTPAGYPLPLNQLAEIRYQRGPQMIRSENTFLTAYVTFGGKPGMAEVEVVDAVATYLDDKLATGAWQLPAGASYSFAGSFEHQQRAATTLLWVVPLALLLIFMLLYLQFRRVSTTLMIFSSIAVAWAGGFIMLDWFAQSWFMNFSLFDTNLRQLFQLQPYNLSIAVWVGFLALFGIAVDDGIVMASYLKQAFAERTARTKAEVRARVLAAAQKRIRPCLMTSATTILALLPVLSATGRGADLMIPMAIPTFGGMLFVLLSVFMVPVLYCAVEERRVSRVAR
ncbi:Cu(I)/Ag(I) efflux system membrane protein CusA/SilA [Arsukibacterium tuosuense]|uniref:Cu(I)/Ag(I) efflux system membrane protein CusA/SilA n=1 Tax=Arsukibacterium tuosuense TaxID=1323745 RepID=A0A285IWL6_9GAMM|nr:efflux RND transporter permease subunit [Arsukibacterium tuosuense]SNY52382.1 Cu(I)/Ag(I) efflux system membrane protein CusA/SilA [Arsukibacterium tuosuense]